MAAESITKLFNLISELQDVATALHQDRILRELEDIDAAALRLVLQSTGAV